MYAHPYLQPYFTKLIIIFGIMLNQYFYLMYFNFLFSWMRKIIESRSIDLSISIDSKTPH